jgi:peptidyl-tRNA hydrolase, PTH1 family
MKLIVGLGNPGPKYESTKHNVGFLVLERLLKDLEPVSKSNWDKNEKFKSEIYVFEYQPKVGKLEKVILAKPLTYMNNSGMAVSLIANFYKIKPKDVWVIHDELDLPLGHMKIRLGGSGAGHHGVESIIEVLKSDKFYRFRLGIGQSKNHDKMARNNKRGEQYVLSDFTGSEKSKARSLVKRGSKALQMALEKGIESSQNQFNTK